MTTSFFLKNKKSNLFVLFFLIGSILISFQNCSKTKFAEVGVDANNIGSNFCVTNPQDGSCQQVSRNSSLLPCQFNGESIPSGSGVTAYMNSNVPYGSTCTSQSRVCTNGVLSGSYNYATCTVAQPASCLFNGQTIAHAQVVQAFQNSTVPYGKGCMSESRLCNNGKLSGSYTYGSCMVGAPASCLFNGQTVTHGQTVPAFQNSNVPYGSKCVSESRTCYNGSFSGTYAYSSCVVGAPASCLFNGQTVAHGQTVPAFQNSNVSYNSTCVNETRLCTNGALSGSYNYASCAVGQPASCLFNGETIAHGQKVIAYRNSGVGYGQLCEPEERTCQNGTLSGSYTYGSCSVGQPAGCNFNGQTVAHGQSVMAYVKSSIDYGDSCSNYQQTRSCDNGNLSGSYNYGSCVVAQPASCLFNGQTIAHGQKVTAYRNSNVGYGQLCEPEERTCQNGNLSGNYSFGSCVIGQPASCQFNGQTVAHGQSVTAFSTSNVAYGDNCNNYQQTRSCNNGNLSGSYNYGSCTTNQPASCLFNGQTIAHGQSITAFASSSVAYGGSCSSESRSCSNGSLSGSYTADSCSVAAPANCNFNGQTVAHDQSITAYSTPSVPWNASCNSYASQRSCMNGNLSGSGSYSSCVVTPPRNCSNVSVFTGAYDDNGNPQYINTTLAHGQTAEVPFSFSDFRWSCPATVPRTCTDGSLSPEPDHYNVCSFNGNPGSPLMIEMDVTESTHQPLIFSSVLDGILFDLLGLNSIPKPYSPVQISWYKEKNYFFLVLPNANGEVHGINELFGDNTFGPDGTFAADGYKALAKYDGMSADGKTRLKPAKGYLTADDAVWSKLRLWNDANYDGKVQDHELKSLDEMGIVYLDLTADKEFLEVDRYGNETRLKSIVKTKDDRSHLMFDVWFKYEIPGVKRASKNK